MIGASKWSRVAFAVWTALIILFITFFPIAIILLYAFNSSNVQSWPLPGLSTRWFSSTWHNAEMRQALWSSVRAGLLATGIATVLATMAAFAVHRFRFFGAKRSRSCSSFRSRCRESSRGWRSTPSSASTASPSRW